MPKWNHTINLKDEWKQTKEDKMTVQQFASIVASKLEKITLLDEFDEEEKDELVEEFKCFSEEDYLTENDFDVLWNEFYYFTDHNRIWVKTS